MRRVQLWPAGRANLSSVGSYGSLLQEPDIC